VSLNEDLIECLKTEVLDSHRDGFSTSSECKKLFEIEIFDLQNNQNYLSERGLDSFVQPLTLVSSLTPSEKNHEIYNYVVTANEATKSEINKLEKEKEKIESDSGSKSVETNQVKEGFGSFSLGSFGGGVDAQVNLVRYNIHYSTNGSIPFYILGTAQATEAQGVEKINQSIIGQDSGLVNFKLATDWNIGEGENGNGNGICDFKGAVATLKGGCWANLQGGVKLLEYMDENDKTKNLGSFYMSGMLTMEFPISDASMTRAGRLISGVGFSGYYANTDKISHLYPEFTDGVVGNVADLKDWYASLDAGLTLTIDDQFSVKWTISKPFVNDKAFETVSSFSITWQPE
jgi:hypothetical protein